MIDLVDDVMARLRASDFGLETVAPYADNLDPKRVARLTKECPAVFVVGGDWTYGGGNDEQLFLLVVTESPALESVEAGRSAKALARRIGRWFPEQDWEPLRVDLEAGVSGGTLHAGDRFAVEKMVVPFVPA